MPRVLIIAHLREAIENDGEPESIVVSLGYARGLKTRVHSFSNARDAEHGTAIMTQAANVVAKKSLANTFFARRVNKAANEATTNSWREGTRIGLETSSQIIDRIGSARAKSGEPYFIVVALVRNDEVQTFSTLSKSKQTARAFLMAAALVSKHAKPPAPMLPPAAPSAGLSP